MSLCCWCTTDDSGRISLLQSYATNALPENQFNAANDDLCFCLECVEGYHKARDELPLLHKVLCVLETSRLICHFEKIIARNGEDDDLYIVEEDRETACNIGLLNFEKDLRIPLVEVLKYPYLLLNKVLSDLCVSALCELEKINYFYPLSFVTDKYPGIYLLMVHPNEAIRRWAILTARNLGKVDRDDYYDLQEVLTCLFKVIELGLFESPDIYDSSVMDEGKLILLPSHLYDTKNYKNYWLGICMLLTVLEEQAMDSLLLGTDKQINFVQSIMSVMEKPAKDQSNDPFWPALHCFMVILDKLGSKVWGQPIDPVEAFQNVVQNPNYKNEIKSIRESCTRTKSEPASSYDDDMMTCSQIVYDYQKEKPQKDVSWKSAICPDYYPNLYEDMQTVADMLQHEVGQDMRLHNSTFLWFIPFVHSVMDLRDGVAYNGEVIHHLCSEIKEVPHLGFPYFDKVSEFFMWILMSVVELHHNKNCLHLLWITSTTWVRVVVNCSTLSSSDFLRGIEKSARSYPTALSQGCDSIQSACMKLIRSLLKEGYQKGQKITCEPFLNRLNLALRGGASHQGGWELSIQERRDLEGCIKQVVRSIKEKRSQFAASGEGTGVCVVFPTISSTKQEKGMPENWCQSSMSCENPSALRGNEVGQEGALPRSNGLGETCKEAPLRAQFSTRTSDCLFSKVKQEMEDSSIQESSNVSNSKLANKQKDAQQNGHPIQREQNQPSDRGVQNPKVSEVFVSKSLATPEMNQNDRNGTEDISNQIKLEKPNVFLKLKERSEALKRKCVVLKAGDEKQQNSGGRESHKPSGVLQRKAVETNGPLSSERAADSRTTLTGDQDLQDSDEDDVPFSTILQKLKSKGSSPTVSTLTDSQVDRDLSKLSVASFSKVLYFPGNSSDESTSPFHSPIQRKVQGVTRSLSANEQTMMAKPITQIITISDSEEEENEEAVKDCLEKQPFKIPERTREQSPLPTCSSPLPFEESASQFFEFETNEDIYSAWEDYREDEKSKEPHLSGKVGTSSDLEAIQQINEWGYDTDFLGDETIEKAAEALEQQVKGAKTERQQVQRSKGSEEGTKRHASVDKEPVTSCSEHVHAKDREHPKHKDQVQPSISTSAIKESSLGKHSLKSKQVKAAHSPKESPKHSTGSTKFSLAKLCRSDSTEEPPRKDHHHKQSTVEKDGQKNIPKNVRGHSPDSVTKLHSGGSTVTEPKLSVKKAKLIPAQNLVVRNRKMLACQERPFQQSTVEKLGLKKAPRKALELSQRSLDNVAQLRNYGKAVGDLGLPKPKAQKQTSKSQKLFAYKGRQVKQSGSRDSEEQQAHRAAKLARKAQLKQSVQSHTSRTASENRKAETEQVGGSSSSERNQLKQSLLEKDGFQLPPEPLLSRRDSSNQDNSVEETPTALSTIPGSSCSSVTGSGRRDSGDVFMSTSGIEGADPKDCLSKLNKNVEEDDGLFLTQREEVDMELCSQEDSSTGMEVDVPQDPLQVNSSETCSHTGCLEKVSCGGAHCREHSVPDPSNHLFAKPTAPARPSTTKPFSSGTSRNANLAKELGSASKGSSARNTSVPSASKAESFRPQTSTVNSILRPQNLNLVPQPQNLHGGHHFAAKKPDFLESNAGQEGPYPSSHPHSANTQQRDFKMFIKEILKWNYNMFADCNHIGAPSYLCQSIVGPVPLKFQDYNDYFSIFFPLMMINAFETVVQDWVETQKSREKSFFLTLVSYSADIGTAYFTVDVPEHDLATQWHPKEDDLVFLTVTEKRSPSFEEKENCDVRYIGLVTQFKSGNTSKKKKVACHLSIQTQGNLFRASKQVKCVVVSSLLTTQRGFRALLLFRRSPLFKTIISPSFGNFCPRHMNTDTKNLVSGEFNEDQRRAIETAYAMVTQKPQEPKICLIHGPPGTGKSRTIIGLLDCILNDSSQVENPAQYPHTRRKQNRILVCAPSNAAVDELMKKIIVVFKEKCRDKEKYLGNCGDINLVRLGQEKSIHRDVRQFGLYDLVERRINRKKAGEDQGCPKEKIAELDHQLDAFSRQRAEMWTRKTEEDRSEDKEKRQQLEDEICRLSKKRQQLASQLKQVHRHSQELKSTIIQESNIICCTLSMSGSPMLESAFRREGYNPFCCIIVDEAGQSCEVETLIPLIHGCKKLVLVGDPKQLPPTVKSRKAQDSGYDQSLMGRLCRHLEEQNWADKLILQLQIQYRMHPDLCLFPSKYIYSGKLITAEETESNRGSLEWPFLPYMFFDVYDGEEKQDGGSFINEQEARIVIELIKMVKVKIGRAHNVGIITPYSAQKRKITKELEAEFRTDRIWEVDTVDGFQGREKSCIIMSCVRATKSPLGGPIGFLRSIQRLNVSITRAKYSLFILGHLETLRENSDWSALIYDAGKRGAITKASCHTCKADLLKILLKTLSHSALKKADRTLPRPVGAAGGRAKQSEAPSTNSRTISTKPPALNEGSGLAQPSPHSWNSSSKGPPLRTQSRPLRERPQDPRLARRADPAARVVPCREDPLPALSSGVGAALPQHSDAFLGQRAWSTNPQTNSSNREPSSRPVPCRQPQGACLPATHPAMRDSDRRVLSTGDKSQTLDWRDYKSRNGEYSSKTRRTSRDSPECRSQMDAKRRRTTY